MKILEICALVQGELSGDGGLEITGVAALDTAGTAELSYADGPRALEQAATSGAGCLLIPQGASLSGHTTIAVQHPKLALIRAAEALHPASAPVPGVHPTAVIAPGVRLGPGVSVGPHVVIEEGVSVGDHARLCAGVFLGAGVEVGSHSILYPRVTVYPGGRIGNRVILHSGVVVGSDGFGYVFAEGRHVKFPQLGRIVIEDDVEIGSNTTLDRGSLGTTVIGQGTKIDNLVQIAHNVKIGRHCVIAAQVGISGSVDIGDYVVMAGQVGIGDHVRIEDQVTIGGQAGILPGKIVRKGSTIWGTPSRPISEFKKAVARMARLEHLEATVKSLSRRIGGRPD